MTPEQKKLLEPFGQALAEWDSRVRDMAPDQRANLEAACSAASTTNCWCSAFDAAKILLPMIRRWNFAMRREVEKVE